MSDGPAASLTPWIGTALRHGNAERHADALDFSHTGLFLTRWNLVLFLDKLPAATDRWITRVERVGQLGWHPA